MARETYVFFDSTSTDLRDYDAADFARVHRAFARNGVKDEEALAVTVTTPGMVLSVAYGVAMIDGYFFEMDDDGRGMKTLQIDAANSQARIDRIVLRLDLSADARNFTLNVLKGTPSATPVPPPLARTGIVYELSLARVRVGANVVALSQADITDERSDPDACGYMMLFQPPGDYLTEVTGEDVRRVLTQPMVEDVLTGTIATHKHDVAAEAVSTSTPGVSVQGTFDALSDKLQTYPVTELSRATATITATGWSWSETLQLWSKSVPAPQSTTDRDVDVTVIGAEMGRPPLAACAPGDGVVTLYAYRMPERSFDVMIIVRGVGMSWQA